MVSGKRNNDKEENVLKYIEFQKLNLNVTASKIKLK